MACPLKSVVWAVVLAVALAVVLAVALGWLAKNLHRMKRAWPQ